MTRNQMQNRPAFYLLPSVFYLFLFFSTASATTYTTLTLEEMIAKADIAFYANVSRVEVITQNNEPWTQVSFTVTEALLGTEKDANEILKFYGGTLDTGLSITVNLMPSFREGEEILILAYKDDYYSPIVGFRQGLWRNQGQGFKDEIGRSLSLVDGRLELDGSGGGKEDILRTLKDMFKARSGQ